MSNFHIDDDIIRQIKSSGLFDEDWYLSTYPDVVQTGIDPLTHFLWIGEKIGRKPSANFNPAEYQSCNIDIIESELSPFAHYAMVGQYENRQTSSASVILEATSACSNQNERIYFEAPQRRAARVIAFHLPQFHQFEENSKWWGPGFTEWANVRPAKPQFHGHYQPHEPHPDIGYYDLLEKQSLKTQVELAKSHGIYGFCYYYYWFDGKRLMEGALDSFLSNKNLDLPFCLCWANENWTRRWDGLDSEILIAQNHSPKDDIDCISDLSRYIKDDRYITIDGRPLVLIYRPSLLPDPAATARRWRQWCRDNDIGEIYLAYTQSFEREDPTKYGFDAAIEFPPNNSGPTDLTENVSPYSNEFSGKIYDWSSLADRSSQYSLEPYKVFRSTCPGWDNTARRKGAASILINNTPQKFEIWMRNAIRDTIMRHDNTEERLVFVNAWNEWAEGAHLEPDMQNGYAYLNAVRRAVQIRPSRPKLAVVIHAFYPDVLPEILEYIRDLPSSTFIMATTTSDKVEVIRAHLCKQDKKFDVIPLENRGRDVLPFLKALEILVEEKFDYVAKVHTKKSLHRDDGGSWRRELYSSVLGGDAFYRSIVAMENDQGLAMLGPKGHLVSMDTYLGKNLDQILKYSQRLGLSHDEIMNYGFFAGTMFIARVSAIEPILRLGIVDEDFENEMGQIDGTLAHALERVFALCIRSNRLRLAFSENPTAHVEINRRYGFA